MRELARRLSRLEQIRSPELREPQAIVYVPCNERDNDEPGQYRVGQSLLVIYTPGGLNDPILDVSPGEPWDEECPAERGV
jgi:hypothetical protein